MLKKIISDKIEKIFTIGLRENKQREDEILYALKCNSVWSESAWLKNKDFAPGGMAMGWQALYILYRTLNALKPKNILELGLGESTKMIRQYVTNGNDISHSTVEHDWDWIKFYDENNIRHDIVQCDLEEISFHGKNVLKYKDFMTNLNLSNKYDLLIVDGPFGGGEYSRVDILDLIPQNLADCFAIIMDDTNRVGEKNTIKLIKNKLEENGIKYAEGSYVGVKSSTIITSYDMRFLCSL